MGRLLLAAPPGTKRCRSNHRYVQGIYRTVLYMRLRSQGRPFPDLRRCQWQLCSIGAFRRCLFDWFIPGRSAAYNVPRLLLRIGPETYIFFNASGFSFARSRLTKPFAGLASKQDRLLSGGQDEFLNIFGGQGLLTVSQQAHSVSLCFSLFPVYNGAHEKT